MLNVCADGQKQLVAMVAWSMLLHLASDAGNNITPRTGNIFVAREALPTQSSHRDRVHA
jgi:hypothetical protein